MGQVTVYLSIVLGVLGVGSKVNKTLLCLEGVYK